MDLEKYLQEKGGGAPAPIDLEAYLREKQQPAPPPIVPDGVRGPGPWADEYRGFNPREANADALGGSTLTNSRLPSPVASAQEQAEYAALPLHKQLWRFLKGEGPEMAAAGRHIKAYAESNPNARAVLGVEGAAGDLARSSLAAGAAGELIGPSASGIDRLTTAAAEGLAGGATAKGSQAAREGTPVLPAAMEGGQEGMAAGAAFGVGAEGARGLGRLLRGGKGLVGQYLRAQNAGTYERPDMKALPEGPEGVQAVSERGLGRIMKRDQELGAAASSKYANDLNPPAPPAPPPPPPRQPPPPPDPAVERDSLFAAARRVDAPGAEPLGPEGERARLFAAARSVDAPGSRPSTGLPLNPPPPAPPPPAPEPPIPEPLRHGLARAVDRPSLLRSLRGQQRATINPDTGMPFDDAVHGQYGEAIDKLGPEGTVNTIGGVLGQRRALKRGAAYGSNNPTPDQVAKRDVYQSYRGAVREAAPDVAAADDAFSQHATKAERRKDILFNTEDNVIGHQGEHPEPHSVDHSDALLEGRPIGPSAEAAAAPPALRVAKERAATATIGRVGDTNVPGLRARSHLEELGSHDPEFEAALSDIRAKKAYEGTRYSLHSSTAPNLREITGPNAWIQAARQNTRALGARVVDPLAEGLSGALGRRDLNVPLLRFLGGKPKDDRNRR